MLFKTIQKIRKNFLGLAVGCLAVVGVTGCQENLQDAVQPQKSRTELTHETEEFKFVRTPTGDVLNTIDTVIFPTLLEDAAKKHGKGLAQKLLNTYDAHTGKMTLQAAKSKEFIEWKNAQKVQANYSITYGARLEGAGTFGYAGAWGAPVGSTHQSKAMFGFAFAINPYRIPAPFTYGMHVSIIGDVTVNCYETVDYNRRIEGFWINNDIITSGFATNVYYQGHLQDRGWDLNITTVPGFIGTRGESRRLEAIKIWLVVL